MTDANTGAPLGQVRIMLDGTNRATRSNDDGEYTLRGVPDGSITLLAIRIGYSSSRASLSVVGGVGQVNFQLSTAVVSLDEIVVTATGEVRKREVANAVTIIDAPAAIIAAPPTFTAMIQGRAAGVQIINSSGTAGTSSTIRIRGSSSISLSNDPLLVVDGIRVEASRNSTGFGVGGQTISRMNDFNPDDIQSIEIVKGPSAAALYGTAAANGVIIITTKRGRVGRPEWSVYTEQGITQEVTTYPANFRGLDAAGNSCRLSAVAAGDCTQETLQTANPLESKTTAPFVTGRRQQYGIQVSGGSEEVQYYVSGEWETEDGVYGLPQRTIDSITNAGTVIPQHALNPNRVERASIRANLQANLGENANLRISTGFISSDIWLPQNDNNSFGMLPSGLLGLSDSTRARNAWGFFVPEEVFFVEGHQAVERFTGSGQMQYRPTTWLTLRGTAGLDFTNRRDIRFQATGTGPPSGTAQLGRRTSDATAIYSYTVDVGGTAQFNVSDAISSKTSVGFQYFRNNLEQIETTGEVFAPGSGSQKSASSQFIDEDFVESKTVGIFIEQNIGFNDRFFLTAAVRGDDNSAFGQDFSFTIYPKLGASYTLIDQGIGAINDFRLRAAFGASGQQPGTNTATKFFVGTAITDAGGTQSGVTISNPGNTELKPERSEEIEAGFDATLFDGRLGIEGTYYRRTTTDALISRRLAPSIGLTRTRTENIGSTRNWGWEGIINAAIIEGSSFGWDMTISGSTNDNVILELGEGVEPIRGTNTHMEGMPLGAFFDETFTFSDVNGDGIIVLSEITFSDTTEFLGYPRPRFEVSFFNSFSLGNHVRIGGLFDYRGGYKKWNLTESFRCGFNICQGLNDKTQSLFEQARAQTRRGGPTQAGFIEDGWFIKLRELSLTLLAPQSFARAFKMDRMSLVITGRNLLTITDYTGLDPEVQGQTGNFSSRDFLTQPQVRFWVARLNLHF
ncbi:MAG: SusC/RagA family TonB-linked outer membrane protein [Chloroflexi bacterium]|nr:SusC/RagA family TonB-linked outer membrane protein [Chloroflexota bacterium]